MLDEEFLELDMMIPPYLTSRAVSPGESKEEAAQSSHHQ